PAFPYTTLFRSTIARFQRRELAGQRIVAHQDAVGPRDEGHRLLAALQPGVAAGRPAAPGLDIAHLSLGPHLLAHLRQGPLRRRRLTRPEARALIDGIEAEPAQHHDSRA